MKKFNHIVSEKEYKDMVKIENRLSAFKDRAFDVNNYDGFDFLIAIALSAFILAGALLTGLVILYVKYFAK